jgi:hypothetical protein
LNFLRMSFVYLAWCTKVPFFACLIWSPRKELQFSHHRHLEFFAHILCKPRNQRVWRATKDNIIHVYLNN